MLLLLSPGLWAQPLRLPEDPAAPPAAAPAAGGPTDVAAPRPLIFRGAGKPPESLPTVEAVVGRFREELREIAEARLSEAERKAALDRLLDDNAETLATVSGEWATNRPRTVEAASALLERMFYEQVVAAAPDEKTLQEIKLFPGYRKIDPADEILIAPRSQRKKIVVTREAELEAEKTGVTPWWRGARLDTESLALDQEPAAAEQDGAAEGAAEAAAEPVKVEVLADEKVTVEMHDDTTVLREVEDEQGGIVLFKGMHLWAGGAVQFDAFTYDDLLNAGRGGGSENDTATRRAELIVRSTLFDWGELKAQYDLDADFWRDLYYRRVNEDKGYTLTIGNQTEPMAQENTLGNKFLSAMERSAPTSIFGAFRGLGVRFNNWFEREQERQLFEVYGGKTAYVTTTVGVFGEDIENTNGTDIALTGRISAGSLSAKGVGLHLGFSATVRDGEFDNINPRPELQEADRISLARFDADQAVVVGVETLGSYGSLHGEAQLFYADYRGGEVDATGYGGYAQVGYYLTGQERGYRPKWGLWAPVQAGNSNVFEVFARVSYTQGNSDAQSSNDLRMLTVGGSWYRQKYRVSLNALYGETDRNVAGEDTGFGAALRFQYLF